MDITYPRHGGDLTAARARYGALLDLSTGVCPYQYGPLSGQLRGLERLPGQDDLDRLVTTVRRAYGVPHAAGLVAVPGSEMAIRLIPVVAPPGPVAIVGPTYGSHAEAWRNSGREMVEVDSLESIPATARIVVIGNPNNPDGRITPPHLLSELATRLSADGGLLIVDEAFADVAPDVSLVSRLSGLPALVLRSFGKFYGLPGVRLGFVAGDPGVVERLRKLLGDWPVSVSALAIGEAALADDAWRDAMRARLKGESATLRQVLTRHGLAIKGGTDLFVLIEDEHAPEIHDGLARRGIWTRAFEGQPTWLRIGLPSDGGLEKLDRALTEIR
jgi:cobalamin biosynthesis protein CobC